MNKIAQLAQLVGAIGSSVQTESLGPCPFCGNAVEVTVDRDGLLHALPMCDQFDQMDVLDFVVAMREKLQARTKT